MRSWYPPLAPNQSIKLPETSPRRNGRAVLPTANLASELSWPHCRRSFAPAQRQRIKRSDELQERGTSLRVKRLQRMAHRIRPDHATLLHHRLARAQPALAVLEIDGRQQLLVERQSLPPPTRAMMSEDRLDQIGDHRACHRAGGTGVEVRQQGDALLAVE